MKKLFVLFLLTISFTAFMGCSSDDDEKSQPAYLVGTTWSGVNNKVDVSLLFTKENGAQLSAGGLHTWYDYYEKSGKIHLKPQKEGFYDFDCSINDKTMTIVNAENGTVTYILHKE